MSTFLLARGICSTGSIATWVIRWAEVGPHSDLFKKNFRKVWLDERRYSRFFPAIFGYLIMLIRQALNAFIAASQMRITWVHDSRGAADSVAPLWP